MMVKTDYLFPLWVAVFCILPCSLKNVGYDRFEWFSLLIPKAIEHVHQRQETQQVKKTTSHFIGC